MLRRLLILIAVGACLVEAGPASTRASRPGHARFADDEAAIRRILENHQRWYNAGDWQSIRGEFADSVLVMPDFTPTVVSRDSVTELFHEIFSGLAEAGATQTMDAHLEEVQVLGDWAFDRGTFTITTRQGEKSRAFHIRFMEIFRRQVDGSWKIVRGMNNYIEAPFPPAPSK